MKPRATRKAKRPAARSTHGRHWEQQEAGVEEGVRSVKDGLDELGVRDEIEPNNERRPYPDAGRRRKPSPPPPSLGPGGAKGDVGGRDGGVLCADTGVQLHKWARPRC
eukprot:4211329-Heterocapsa_arctica.AAC.1